ncbi:hypothetical protein ACWIG5_22045 [Streptomyces lydicus]
MITASEPSWIAPFTGLSSLRSSLRSVFRDEEHLADFLTGGFEDSEEVTSLECSLQLEVLKRYWAPRP